MTIGYVVMRIALVAQWLRGAASATPLARPAALRYVGLHQPPAGRLGRRACSFPAQAGAVGVLRAGFACEMARARPTPSGPQRRGTPGHPGHIAERYGLFTLIVLGECIAVVTVALH